MECAFFEVDLAVRKKASYGGTLGERQAGRSQIRRVSLHNLPLNAEVLDDLFRLALLAGFGVHIARIIDQSCLHQSSKGATPSPAGSSNRVLGQSPTCVERHAEGANSFAP